MRLQFLVVALLAGAAAGQVTPAWWTPHVTPSGSASNGRATAVDSAGNVFTAGHNVPALGAYSQLVVLKHSAAGAQLWAVEIDVLPYDEVVSACALGPNGGLYVCGQAVFVSQVPMMFLAAVDANGALLWSRTITGTGQKVLPSTLAVAPNGDVFLAGTLGGPSVTFDGVVERYASSGIVLWSRWLDSGAGAHEYVNRLEIDPSGAVFVGGTSEASGTRDIAVWKLASNGSTLWSRVSGGAQSDSGAALELSPTGKLLVAGSRGTYDAVNGTDSEWLVEQLDGASGALEWSHTQSNGATGGDSVVDVALDARGVWWIAGVRTDPGGSRGAVVQRVDAHGALLSTHTWAIGSAFSPPGYTSTHPQHWLRGPAGQMWLTAMSAVPDTAAQPLGQRCVVAQYSADGALDWLGYLTALPGKRYDQFVQAAFAPPAQIVFGGVSSDQATGVAHGFTAALDFSRMPHSYCTAKTTSNGCVPRIEISGMPSAAATSGFVVRARELRNQKNGLLFYGASGAQAVPFKGGTLCVAPPLVRAPMQSSGGSAATINDCSGVFALDLNAFAHSPLANLALLAVGTTINAQFWGRDAGFAPPSGVMLTNALQYDVQP